MQTATICTESLQPIFNQVKLDFEELGIPYGRVNDVDWNGRLKRTMGRCRKKPDGFEIEISKIIEMNDEYLKETMAHELLHTVEGCFNHKDMFRHYGNILSKKGYHVARLANYKFDDDDYKYVMRCKHCGQLIRQHRMTRFIKDPTGWTCGKCNHSEWERIK